MIVNQLQSYGLKELAGAVAIATGMNPAFAPSGRLLELVSMGKVAEEADSDGDAVELAGRDAIEEDEDEDALNIDPNEAYQAKPEPNYSVWASTVHKGAVKCASFSPDGAFMLWKGEPGRHREV